MVGRLVARLKAVVVRARHMRLRWYLFPAAIVELARVLLWGRFSQWANPQIDKHAPAVISAVLDRVIWLLAVWPPFSLLVAVIALILFFAYLDERAAQRTAIASAPAGLLSLREEARELSRQLHDFLTDRRVDHPRHSQFSSPEEFKYRSNAYVEETVGRYRARYKPRALRLIYEFNGLGLIHSRFSDLFEHEVNHLGIQAVADALGVLGEGGRPRHPFEAMEAMAQQGADTSKPPTTAEP